MPKIFSPPHPPPHRVLPVPQTAEQLVDVPLPEWMRLALGSDAFGRVWTCVWMPSTGVNWILEGTRRTQRTRPTGFTASPGGIKILGKAGAGLCSSSSSSPPSSSSRCLSFSSSTEWWLLQLLHRHRARSANCTEYLRFQGAVFWMVVDMPVGVQTTRFGQTVQNTLASQLHSSDKVVGVPAVAVHRQGVDVPVIMERRCLAVGGASDSAHRRSQRTIQLQQRRIRFQRG